MSGRGLVVGREGGSAHPDGVKRSAGSDDNNDMKIRRLLTTGAAALALAAVAPSAPAAAQWTSQPTMVGSNDVTVVRGGETWVNVAWTAPTAMENFRIRAYEWSRDTSISYANDGDAAYLNQDATLEAGEMDVTSFKLETGSKTPSRFYVQIIVEWEFEGSTYRYYPGGLDFTAIDHSGADYELVGGNVATVAAEGDGSGNWVELDFHGLAPINSDIEVEVEGDLEVYYPQETFTSLHHDARLHAGETDVARLWIDPDVAEPGEYDLKLVVSYSDVDGRSRTETHPLSITVD